MSELGAVIPFWLYRPDLEALDVAETADRLGYRTLWIGEMVTFDAFALATAIGMRTKQIGLRIGPLAVGVRSPVSIALGLSSVARLIGRPVDVALGASSPTIVTNWHNRPFGKSAARMRETVWALRGILEDGRSDFHGEQVQTKGFRLRHALPSRNVTIAAFGPMMTKIAAEEADEVVLNIVTPGIVARVREAIDAHAREAGVKPPRLAVWVSAAINPGAASYQQLAAQLVVYLKPPGYGEMFTELGYGELVERARAGESYAKLAQDLPAELLARVCAIGTAEQIADRIAKYHQAGADHVAIVPSTAEDPAGSAVLTALKEYTLNDR
ncbi:LLM class F420-dependent oxidoreductase [Kibdelosporangium philippinense]|uniref:LLM class F420-dependent oxidoreductase n=1 Tax=Kibdelosporangium philippinense TaxID=211113 RepID=A0ABS8Z7S5_9PSEU|nr:LLM class F420-dependent oxidoreductase [Kibdelosporangium philippinense]MCE7003929.1 LLM class F420-dependent oxidoreductase [Kibdelosporangium philippinense]